jgi:hypothetical protein
MIAGEDLRMPLRRQREIAEYPCFKLYDGSRSSRLAGRHATALRTCFEHFVQPPACPRRGSSKLASLMIFLFKALKERINGLHAVVVEIAAHDSSRFNELIERAAELGSLISKNPPSGPLLASE